MNIKHLLLLFAIPLALFSCSKDKDESSPSIVGKWESVTDTYQYYDVKGVELVDKKEVEDFKDYAKKPYIEFKSDGTATFFEFDEDGKAYDPEVSNYTVNGDKLTVTEKDVKDPEVSKATFSIKNDMLTIVGVAISPEDGTKEVMTSVYKKIK